jgi:hypothetical protein
MENCLTIVSHQLMIISYQLTIPESRYGRISP